ncbi:exodeoxyribonuclease V subunit alpha [Idiomarina aquatica]|uniref:RecBCD enzyme subunit RecD n=1 Tax=Idiomarina aquatica TaxID=1327752 RepID=A0AA94EDU7_9GAMM|nr:exodeoxyribonuclease V subunit alpha [Idiomarina aquatica]RUO40387.1 exodeoxyribonuclease V subunit alpha [Idiomarina aquatica]
MTDTLVPTLEDALQQWRDANWIRSIDVALVELLQQAGEQNPAVLLASLFASHQVGRGHTVLHLNALAENPNHTLALPPVNNTAGDCVTPAELLEQCWPKAEPSVLESTLCVDTTGEGQQPLVLINDQLYLRRYYLYERFIEADLKQRMDDEPVVNEELLQQTLALLFASSADDKINWQRLACANTVKHRFSVLTGGPGTGKTYTVVRLLTALQHQTLKLGLPPLRISLAAPTGKAAARLRESIEAELKSLKDTSALASLTAAFDAITPNGKTLHRLLGVMPNSRQFKHNERNPLRTDVVIVDEASMMDIEMMVALLKATPKHARLVLIGDKDQLASVEAGAVLGNLCAGADQGHYHPSTVSWLERVAQSPSLPREFIDADGPQRLQHVVMLRESRRFFGPIADLANAINYQQQEQITEELAKAGRAESDYPVRVLDIDSLDAPEFKQLVRDGIPRLRRDDFDSFDDYVKATLDANTQFQILTALREGPWGMKAVNQKVGEILGVNANSWYDGRPVMVTKNDYGLKLNNGDIGIAFADPEHGHLRVAFPDDSDNTQTGKSGIRWVLPSRLTHIETVYAMTVHKSQGSEFKHTVMVLPDHDTPVMSKELLYTGITRAKERLSLVGNNLFSQGGKRV